MASDNHNVFLYASFLLKREASDVSPTHAFLLSKSAVLEKYYNFLPEENPFYKLLHCLFYCVKGVEFDVTKKHNEIGRYLTPFSIGLIIASIKNYNEKMCSEKELFYKLIQSLKCDTTFLNELENADHQFNEISKPILIAINQLKLLQLEIESLQKKKSSIQKEIDIIDSCLKKQIHLIEKNIPEEFKYKWHDIKQVQKNFNKYRKNNDVINKNNTYLYLVEADKVKKWDIKKIKNGLFCEILVAIPFKMKQAYEKYQKKLNLLKQELLLIPTAIEEIRKTIGRLIEEEWDKNGIKKVFITSKVPFKNIGRYLEKYLEKHLENINPEKEKILSVKIEEFASIITKAAVEQQDSLVFPSYFLYNIFLTFLIKKAKSQQQLLDYFYGISRINQEYLSENWKQVIDNFKSNHNLKFSPEDPLGKIVFNEYEKEVFECELPPLCSTTFIRMPQAKEIMFPDCGESCLRNFFNLFLKDKKRFNVDILRNCNLRIHPKLISYYEKFYKIEEVCSQRYHSEWAAVIADLNKNLSQNHKIEYLSPQRDLFCEIAAGAKNAVNVLRALTGENDLNRIITELSSSSKIAIRFDLKNFVENGNDIPDFHNKITLLFKESFVEWYFLKQHFRMYIKLLNTYQSHSEIQLYFDEIKNKIFKLYSDQGYLNAICLKLKKLHYSEIMKISHFAGMDLPTKLQLALS